jgi:hypothetical protein
VEKIEWKKEIYCMVRYENSRHEKVTPFFLLLAASALGTSCLKDKCIALTACTVCIPYHGRVRQTLKVMPQGNRRQKLFITAIYFPE